MPGLNIELPGFIPYTETAAQLHQASVGIVPYEESSGVHCAFVAKIVEYLATGLPVVSTALQSASRYFKNEPAATFTAFKGEAFGNAILDWLKMPVAERQSLGRSASISVARHLNWSTICRNAAQFVEHAIHPNP
jgi:glycosyltransferase involved in cell wall biosynthesis